MNAVPLVAGICLVLAILVYVWVKDRGEVYPPQFWR